MLDNQPSPLLTIASDVLREVDNAGSLWALFSKCKGSLKDGERLENLSWRLWHRGMVVDRHRTCIHAQNDSMNDGVSRSSSEADGWTINAHPSPPPLSTTLTASRTPLANPSYSAAYRSPAPSLVSFSSPSASVIAFSESANGSSGSESDSGANSSDVQLGRLMSSSGGGTLSFPTTSAPLVHIAETTCPSCHLKSTKSHIPSPITSPSPSPCPSSPTPSQTVAADQTSTDDSAYPAHSTTAAGNDVTHNGAGDNEINGDLCRPDAGRRHDISERDSGCGSGGNRKVAQSSIRSNAGIVSSTDNVADAIIRTNGSTMMTSKMPSQMPSQMPSPGFLITDGLHRRILHTHRSPLTAGRMISDIIPGDVTFPSALHEQHSRDPIPSLYGSIQSPMLPNGKFCSPSQRQCPLPTPEHESVGLNLNVASSALYDKPPSEASCKPVSPTVAVTITPSPSPSPQHAPAPVYVTSASHLPASNPATPNRSPTHSVPGTPQFHSPVTSHPHTPTTFLRTSPRTPTTNPGSVNLALAPLVVVVNPTPQPTPHPTPPTTPTLVSAIVPSFVTACGVGLGPDQTSNSANIQSSLPTANAPASSSPRTSTLPTPHGNAILDTDRTRTGSVLACMGTTASARGPLPVPDQRDELPPGKPPSSVSPQLSKPGLSVMVDKDRTLKPSDRRFFLLQSPERSPDSVVSPGASSSTDIACSDDSSKNANLGRPTVVVAPRVAQRGREPAMEVVDEDKVTARNTWQSEDVDPGAVKERSLSRDSRPPSRTKNRSSGALTASKRTTSTTSLAGGTRARTKGLGLGGGLTMTKGKGVVGRTGITGKGALGMKRAASSGILPTVTAAHADELSTKKAVVANGKGKSSRAEVLTPPCPNAVMHRASFNIGSGSSEGVEVGEGGETSSRSASASIGGSGGARELTRKIPTAARSSKVVPNGGRQSPPPLEGQITNKPTKLPIPPQVVARLPNPASLALNPEAATAAIQPSRKRVVMTNTSSEDYETESNSEEEEEEAGSWASEDISEGDDDEMGFAKGGQKGGSSSVGKRSHQRGGSVGSRGKGPSSGHSRIGGPSKAKVKSPLQAPAPAPAQRTKSSGLQHQHQRPVAPQLHRRHTSTAIHPQAQAARRLLSKEDEAALKLQAAAVEAQRQRELFTKVPVQPTMQRTRSGLLSQLMNPDPSIFPPNHPYRQSYSAVDLRKMATVPRVVSAGAGGFAIRSGGNVVATLPSIDDITSGHVRRPSEQAPKLPPIVGSWRSTKGAAAMPLAAQVTVSNVPAPNQSGGSGPYRPKGRPQEEELEDDTDTDDNADNSVPMSESYVYQKLAQMVGRRGAVANGKQRADAVPPKRPEPIRALTTSESTSSHDARVSATPVPLAHPYNLPPPSPPSTPRTTRQRFLQSEMPESLRRNLLWERQVSKMNLGPRRRSTGTGEGTAGRPGHLTTTPSMVQLSAKTSNTSVREEEEKERQRQRELEAKENEERMRRVLAKTRNRSWADDYHASGW